LADTLGRTSVGAAGLGARRTRETGKAHTNTLVTSAISVAVVWACRFRIGWRHLEELGLDSHRFHIDVKRANAVNCGSHSLAWFHTFAISTELEVQLLALHFVLVDLEEGNRSRGNHAPMWDSVLLSGC